MYVKITSPGDYDLTKFYTLNEIVGVIVKETENVKLYGKQLYMDGSREKQPDIILIKSKDVDVIGDGLIMKRTRVKAQAFSKNVNVENLVLLNSHTSSFSFKTEWHVDKGPMFADQDPSSFIWDYANIINCISLYPESECIYIGSQKPEPHYFKRINIIDFYGKGAGRETCQIANVYELLIRNMVAIDSGRNRTWQQCNGVQISNSHGIIDRLTIDQTGDIGLLLFSYGLQFIDLKVSNIPNHGIYIGQVDKRFPGSPMNDGRELVFTRPVIKNCKYGINVRSEEMKVILIDPVFEDCEHDFHPDSFKNNVEIIRL